MNRLLRNVNAVTITTKQAFGEIFIE